MLQPTGSMSVSYRDTARVSSWQIVEGLIYRPKAEPLTCMRRTVVSPVLAEIKRRMIGRPYALIRPNNCAIDVLLFPVRGSSAAASSSRGRVGGKTPPPGAPLANAKAQMGKLVAILQRVTSAETGVVPGPRENDAHMRCAPEGEDLTDEPSPNRALCIAHIGSLFVGQRGICYTSARKNGLSPRRTAKAGNGSSRYRALAV